MDLGVKRIFPSHGKDLDVEYLRELVNKGVGWDEVTKKLQVEIKKWWKFEWEFPGGAERQKVYLEKEGHTIVKKGKKLKVLDVEKFLVRF